MRQAEWAEMVMNTLANKEGGNPGTGQAVQIGHTQLRIDDPLHDDGRQA
jgi:hypothetical protein